MTKTITHTDLAELYDAIGWAGAAQTQRELAAGELDPQTAWYRDEWEWIDQQFDALMLFLSKAPKPAKGGEHDADCWKVHPGCLAEKVREIAQGEA